MAFHNQLGEEGEKIAVQYLKSKGYIIHHTNWRMSHLEIDVIAEHKNELDPKILKECDVYVPDHQSQTSILGELHHALKGNLINLDKQFNDLGSIILDPNLGRKNKEDITICDLTGTGVQDTAIARYAYAIADKKKLGIIV